MTALDDLRRRVEALDQRAATPEPAPAPAADRPLWKVMQAAFSRAGVGVYGYAAEIDAVAEWLDARAVGVDAVAALRAEARRAREGA